jgi:hypothetical protein
MVIQVGPNLAAIRRASARRAVGAHLNVQWTDAAAAPADGTYGGRNEGIQAGINSLAAIKNGSPSLIFVFSDETKPQPPPKGKNPKKSDPEPTQQARDCDAAWAELFQKESDFNVFIPGRFFNVVKLNATDVKESQNKYICSEKAPIVVLTRKSGEIEEILEGRTKIKATAVAKIMSDILRKDGYVTGSAQFAELNSLMVDLEKTELALLMEKEDMDKVKRRLAEAQGKAAKAAAKAEKKGKEAKPSDSVESAQKSVEEFEQKIKDKLKEKQDVLQKEYALLKDLGLPSAKMPPAPANP